MTEKKRFTSLPLPLLAASVVTLAFTAGCSGDGDNSTPAPQATQLAATVTVAPKPSYEAEIRRTSFGVPHIKAKDEAGLGFGVGYVYAQDNLCLMADEIVTVNGERSKYFGPDKIRTASELPNVQTDFFYRLINDAAAVDTAWKKQPAASRALIEGYVEGYNRYLSEAPSGNLNADCRGAPWVRKITSSDMIKLLRRYAAEGGAGQFIGPLLAATPPGVSGAAPAALSASPVKPSALNPMQPDYWKKMRGQTGSNGVALGKEATPNGMGMLLGNPHFPWYGALRFYQLHLTIPGKLDVMGAALGGMPMVNIGFNKNVAWTHTVNSSAHFTVHALTLDPSDPTKYIVDGQRVAMNKKTVTIEVPGPGGTPVPVARDFYTTRFGTVIVIPGMLGWGNGMAYALRDANLDNHRMLEQWQAMGSARNVGELSDAVDRIVGLPWVNTIAADRQGNTLYMDVTVVPNVSHLKQLLCVPPPFAPLAKQGLFVLNGATSLCQWDNDYFAPQDGIFAGYRLPRLSRRDYVQNSNDSAWLSNPAQPLFGYPAIVSTAFDEQMPRTRLGITQLRARLSNSDGLGGRTMTMNQLQTMVLNNRVYFAEQVMDDVLKVCAAGTSATTAEGTAVDLTVACNKLTTWDRTASLDANTGFVYFGGLWDRIAKMPNLWAVPFSSMDPVNTPRGLNISNPAVAGAVRQSLAAAWVDATAKGISPEAKWGQIQIAARGNTFIPIAGGEGEYGIYNAMSSIPVAPGVRNVVYGTSYIQTVHFNSSGVQAQAFLSYSQSSDPASPHYADQTARFAAKAWIPQVFTEDEIKADPKYTSTKISK